VSDRSVYPLNGVLSPANAITSLRLVGAPFLYWAVLASRDDLGTSWIAFVLGFALAVTDYLDGPVARRSKSISRGGAFLDPLADKVVVIGVALCLVSVDRLHWIPVAIVIIREVGISVLRVYWAKHGLSMPARRSAKHKATVQGAALLLAVMPTMKPYGEFVHGFWWAAVLITLISGYQYIVDGSAATRPIGHR